MSANVLKVVSIGSWTPVPGRHKDFIMGKLFISFQLFSENIWKENLFKLNPKKGGGAESAPPPLEHIG
jgi:hypothetical protein